MFKIHYGNVDKDGNYRDQSRKSEGYLTRINNDIPFPALVTAWYPKSQTIEVMRPVENGYIEYNSVIVYGNFFEATGTIQSPKIATKRKDDGFTTYRDADQVNPVLDDYVLNNHIEAIVYKISVGNTFAFAADSFRFLNPDSPLLNNAKEGRKITRLDDGSYYIHDEDGNIQFKHPSGLNIRIGDSTADLDLDVPFPEHDKNVLDYGGTVQVKVEHPLGSVVEYDAAGLLGITGATGKNLKTIINAINAEIQKIVVANGTGPDVPALIQLQADLALVLK